jgi:hypothetical protein
MPKKIKFESFKTLFFYNLNKFKYENNYSSKINELINIVTFDYINKEIIIKINRNNEKIKKIVQLSEFRFYERGDSLTMSNHEFVDSNKEYNKLKFSKIIIELLEKI